MRKKEILIGISGLVVCAAVVLYCFCFPGYAGGSRKISELTTVVFERDTLSLGMVKSGVKREALFRFTNQGGKPLIIRDVRPSCGCTKVDWDKRPVEAGKSGEIRILFESVSPGWFSKDIEVFCNVESRMINLKIYGRVTD